MKPLTHRSVTIALLLFSVGLALLPTEILSAWRLALYSGFVSARRQAAPESVGPTLESRRASREPGQRLRDLERQAHELSNLLEQRTSELEDTRRRLRQLSQAREFIPELKTLHFVTASVILHAGHWPGAAGGGSLVFDRGREDGVTVGSALLQGQAVLGQVVEVAPHASRGILLNHPNLIIAARLGGKRTECYLRGSVAGVCEIVFLGQKPDAQAGDLIFTSGLLGYFPKNLILGELATAPVEDVDQRTFVARLRPAAELDAVEGVIIVNGESADSFPEIKPGQEEARHN